MSQVEPERFDVEVDGTILAGEVRARNWRAHNFDVLDASGRDVARVTQQWRGLFTEGFTDADSYAVEFRPDADLTMRGLAFASALAVDLVMKEKDTG